MNTKTVIAVVGPTAIGKTARAIDLANTFDTEILSADSRQFYKEMHIGTAVPSKEELNATKHHFIQHKSIFDAYSVGHFESDALRLLEQLFEHKGIVILVGGSGLYVDAVINGLDVFPKVAPSIRENLNMEWKAQGLPYLQQQLKQLDPNYYQKVDLNNPYRVIRALEICVGTKRPYSSYLSQKKKERPFKTIYLGLQAERTMVYDRINARVDQMLQAGLVEEAKTLLPHKNLNALQTVGYQELFKYFEGVINLDTAIEEIKKNTRRFAKRQLTWLRKNKEIQWFPHDLPIEDVLKQLNV
ncbi:tRNA delta(2)-isopentenylpyrophosphate transferase [Croceitalea dokdonensis DOKDO 023]|uniref:tRNA dimethylallyltransferase n=1 Tax=Croceitalea dokdonensis DOKDO 023 TaxID=1300341 RepID=A0A0P7B2J5_9FLAO|nr:tRNA (adenosine(37)-N6)-dimethylallyltransferase MiaA [Croceitalea dokdonensis]KPM33666.1 tRNA delta(2)-isopentenylpyrophosphate transferase [Croceitalea dokdonensis DOKDO 023]